MHLVPPCFLVFFRFTAGKSHFLLTIYSSVVRQTNKTQTKDEWNANGRGVSCLREILVGRINGGNFFSACLRPLQSSSPAVSLLLSFPALCFPAPHMRNNLAQQETPLYIYYMCMAGGEGGRQQQPCIGRLYIIYVWQVFVLTGISYIGIACGSLDIPVEV